MAKEGEYFSRARLGSQSGPAPDDLIGPLQTPNMPGGIMGRLKNFGGKMSIKRPPSEFNSLPVTSSTAPTEMNAVEVTICDILLFRL
jgi:WD repeat-containing protein 48